KKPWNVKVWAVKQKENVYRLIIKNDYFAYRECDISVGSEIENCSIITEYPYAPVKFEKDRIIHLVVPNFGCEVIEVTLKK
ncbi:MAG: hypothetical protein KBT47_00055, partial [Armatimonadetes bacterium]|nr:hypothetical protein [Candidatus Hippobium faecium]